ncbi:SDR family oxidoreductase [Oryzifoliimicrobium ureilyticus]|uniref:SDR family oxidoreductase n=1 Tax=Oryzifoliimicrobium ureilyticus TaxID=3113724 RepID=UPI0030767170
MRIFLTGATGFIGSAIIPELLKAGHEVVGTARSSEGMQRLSEGGITAYRADLDEPGTFRAGAEHADAIIHTAFDHNFTRFVDNCEKDRRVITVLGEALLGSNRPLLITSGTGMGNAHFGELAREDVFNRDHPNPRIASELAGQALLEQGVNVSVVRLPQVHNPFKQGLISPFIEIARDKGMVGYVGEGKNRFSAAHLSDVALLYRLAIERGEKGARYHAVDEEGVAMRQIAEVLGEVLDLPVVSVPAEDAGDHFGWMAIFMGMDFPASSAKTREVLGWNPVGPSLVEDLRAMKAHMPA